MKLLLTFMLGTFFVAVWTGVLDGTELTAESRSHVSVYRLPVS